MGARKQSAPCSLTASTLSRYASHSDPTEIATNVRQTFFSEAPLAQKITALRNACQGHVKLTKECSQGHGQDRHLYALYCLIQRDREAAAEAEAPPSPGGSLTSSSTNSTDKPPLPAIFTDAGWRTLGTSILSTSNCGNPALRLFGFGPVAADGYGIGYIIKDEGISV